MKFLFPLFALILFTSCGMEMNTQDQPTVLPHVLPVVEAEAVTSKRSSKPTS